jgi:hypothetical protein
VPEADSKRVHCHQARARQPAAATITNAISAGLLRRVVDTSQRYRAVLRPDEFIEPGSGGFAVDGDDLLARPNPRNLEGIKCSGEQPEDVLGHIREVVADAADAAVVRDDATAVVVDETEDKFFGGLVNVCLLLGFELDRT